MNTSNVPHILGSKLIGDAASSAQVAKVAAPHLGLLALGIADRNGNPIDQAVAPPASVPVNDPAEIDALNEDDANLNGTTPALVLGIADTPEVKAAEAALESAVESAARKQTVGKAK